MDESEEPSGELIVAGGDPTIEFQLLEEALDKVALFVLPPVTWLRFQCV